MSTRPSRATLTAEARSEQASSVAKLTLWTGKRRTCAAAKRNGEPCGNWAVNATDRCIVHGGGSPGTLVAYQGRLQALLPDVIDHLVELYRDPLVADETRLKALIAVLDRAGLGPHAKLSIEKTERIGLNKLSAEELVSMTEAVLARIKAKQLPAGPGDVVDAEVVDPYAALPVAEAESLLREADEKIAAGDASLLAVRENLQRRVNEATAAISPTADNTNT